MFPNLSYFSHWLFGTNPDNALSLVNTFGLFLAAGLFVASYFLQIELKRKEKEGIFSPEKLKMIKGTPITINEILINAFYGFLFGFKGVYIFQNISKFKENPAGSMFSLDGNWIAGILVAILFGFLIYRDKQKAKLDKPVVYIKDIYPSDRIGTITMIAGITGIIGAKLFAVIENLPAFFSDPIGTFISGSGLAIYGGLIGGFIGVYIYLKGKNISTIHVMDAIAPAMIIGYGVGRIGCQLSGDGDWGIVAAAMPEWWFLPEWLWSYDYPHNVNKEGIPIDGCTWEYCMKLSQKVYPTPLYEIAMTWIIGGFLWFMRKRVKIVGILFFIYVFLNGVERFIIEKIRVNIKYETIGITYTQAELIAVILMIVGVIGILYLRKNGKKIIPST